MTKARKSTKIENKSLTSCFQVPLHVFIVMHIVRGVGDDRNALPDQLLPCVSKNRAELFIYARDFALLVHPHLAHIVLHVFEDRNLSHYTATVRPWGVFPERKRRRTYRQLLDEATEHLLIAHLELRHTQTDREDDPVAAQTLHNTAMAYDLRRKKEPTVSDCKI